MLYKKIFQSIFLILIYWLPVPVVAQSKINPDSIRNKMQWFADAKLGIFIHWGIYAVNGIAESWSFHNGQISLGRLYEADEWFYGF